MINVQNKTIAPNSSAEYNIVSDSVLAKIYGTNPDWFAFISITTRFDGSLRIQEIYKTSNLQFSINGSKLVAKNLTPQYEVALTVKQLKM